ncbi:MAG: helix-turn-helix transcriptional regulator [Bacilli bacterium]|nr:helix-turn-helix transcriptional regulator [Bacilli bacterium]
MLKEYRLKRGLTLEKLAEQCDISWRNLQRIENGNYVVAKFETIQKLLVILEVEDNDILTFIKSCKKDLSKNK